MYNGLLFQFGNYVIPNKYIKYNTYKAKPNQRQDRDSYTDANGETHRNALTHTKTHVQFTLIEIPEKNMRPILDALVSNYIDYKQRDANCIYYDDENGAYKSGHMYMDPSVEFAIKEADGSLVYGETNMQFTEY